MKIVLVSRIDNEDALRYTAELARDLEGMGHDIVLEEGTGRHLGRDGIPFQEFAGDLVVVVGGDGSVLLAVHQDRKSVV